MRLLKTSINGLYLLKGKLQIDIRGKFFKFFNKRDFEYHNLEASFSEVFISTSKLNTIRGMHFQIPPYAEAKLVTVIKGEILDLILDLRYGSPTYGKYQSFILSDRNPTSLYVSKGFAHGFLAMKNNSMVCYMVSEVHNQEFDSGIRWDSFGYKWGINSPIVSERDKSLDSFSGFKSPFIYVHSKGD